MIPRSSKAPFQRRRPQPRPRGPTLGRAGGFLDPVCGVVAVSVGGVGVLGVGVGGVVGGVAARPPRGGSSRLFSQIAGREKVGE